MWAFLGTCSKPTTAYLFCWSISSCLQVSPYLVLNHPFWRPRILTKVWNWEIPSYFMTPELWISTTRGVCLNSYGSLCSNPRILIVAGISRSLFWEYRTKDKYAPASQVDWFCSVQNLGLYMGEYHKSMRGTHQPTSMFRDTGLFHTAHCLEFFLQSFSLEGKEAPIFSVWGSTEVPYLDGQSRWKGWIFPWRIWTFGFARPTSIAHQGWFHVMSLYYPLPISILVGMRSGSASPSTHEGPHYDERVIGNL